MIAKNEFEGIKEKQVWKFSSFYYFTSLIRHLLHILVFKWSTHRYFWCVYKTKVLKEFKMDKVELINKNHEKKKRDENKGILEKNSTEKRRGKKIQNHIQRKRRSRIGKIQKNKKLLHPSLLKNIHWCPNIK